MEDAQAFKKLLTRLSPTTLNNEHAVRFMNAYSGDPTDLLKVLLEEMGRSSLNGRVKILNLVEYCVGIVGKYEASEQWKALLCENIQRFVDSAVPIQYAPPSLVNLEPARRFVQGFRMVNLIDETKAERIIAQIDSKRHTIEALAWSKQGSTSHQVTREEILRRMEDDRERSKKYKERELSVKIGSLEEFERYMVNTDPLSDADAQSLDLCNALAGL